MNNAFVTKILELMEHDQNMIFLTADLGFGTFDIIQERYKERFYNVGIAEQNMIGVACGMGLAGKKIIIYSIANFPTLRVVEQIRNYLIYHNTHALVVNGSGGFSFGALGYTHHATEDISIMRSLPQIAIYAPYNSKGINNAVDSWLDNGGVSYLRLDKDILEDVGNVQQLSPFNNIIGDKNAEYFIITYGSILKEALKARSILLDRKINLGIIVMSSLKHIDSGVLDLVNNKSTVVFLEENSRNGGVGEQFFAQCMLHNVKIDNTKLFAVEDFISDVIGDQKYMRKLHGISANHLVEYFTMVI